MVFGIKYNEKIKNVDKYLKILNLKDIKVKQNGAQWGVGNCERGEKTGERERRKRQERERETVEREQAKERERVEIERRKIKEKETRERERRKRQERETGEI